MKIRTEFVYDDATEKVEIIKQEVIKEPLKTLSDKIVKAVTGDVCYRSDVKDFIKTIKKRMFNIPYSKDNADFYREAISIIDEEAGEELQ